MAATTTSKSARAAPRPWSAAAAASFTSTTRKNIVWTTNGIHNTIYFTTEIGQAARAPGELVLNLLTGTGINPWGGTINVQRVDNIYASGVNNTYIVLNNEGDTVGGDPYCWAAIR